MANDNQTNTTSGVKKIAPASVDLSNQSKAEAEINKPKSANKLLLIMLPVVFLAALAVIFVLPAMVSKPETPTTTATKQDNSTTTSTNTATPRPSTATGISPWQKAQQTELRKETQNILAEMLEAQKTLMVKGVEVWAKKEHGQALQHAETGDDNYSNQDFVGAKDQYSQALAIFSELLERVDIMFEETMIAGHEALLEGDSEKAHAAFDLALVIDSIDRKALAGKERADKIDSVFSLLDQGEEQLQDNKLSEAKSSFQQAHELDKEHPLASERIKHVNELIKDRDFGKAMSTGFNHLQNNNLEKARQSFTTALRISPNSKDAISALNQTRHSITSRDIGRLLKKAEEYENAEQWQPAMENYQAALKLDANLVTAQQGLNRTKVWTDIHAKIDQILAKPERLYDQTVFNETSTFLASIEKVTNPGEKFNAKLAKLNMAVAKADNPILIRLQSDSKTNVTVYKVGELGLFTNKELVLRPGKYVAVGKRDGYRDVRVEFFVEPDKPVEPILVVSQEKIALSK